MRSASETLLGSISIIGTFLFQGLHSPSILTSKSTILTALFYFEGAVTGEIYAI